MIMVTPCVPVFGKKMKQQPFSPEPEHDAKPNEPGAFLEIFKQESPRMHAGIFPEENVTPQCEEELET